MVSVWVTNAWRSDFVYDGKMRCRIRIEYTWNGSIWATNQIVRYVYDGNLVIQERDGNNLPLVTYTRGKDLSGTLEGAGGIGGLLARTDHRLSAIGDASAPKQAQRHAMKIARKGNNLRSGIEHHAADPAFAGHTRQGLGCFPADIADSLLLRLLRLFAAERFSPPVPLDGIRPLYAGGWTNASLSRQKSEKVAAVAVRPPPLRRVPLRTR